MMEMPHPEWAEWFDADLAIDLMPVRHRVFYGGRGGRKSWAAAAKLIERVWVSPLTILCLRDFQNSIDDSAKQLIDNLIDKMELGPTGARFFRFGRDEIVGSNGSRFIFRGLHGKEMAIKSTEGVNIAWVEEASSISQSAIDALIPTIREEGSEIWWTYNPRFSTDPVDRLFRSDGGRRRERLSRKSDGRTTRGFPRSSSANANSILSVIWKSMSTSGTAPTSSAATNGVPQLAGTCLRLARHSCLVVRCRLGVQRPNGSGSLLRRSVAGEPGTSEIVADPKGKCLFVDYEAYQIGCELDDIPALFAGYDTRNPPRWPNRYRHPGIPGAAQLVIRADNARPETVSKMVSHGLRMVSALKGPGSLEDGIEFLKNYDIVVHRRCRHLIQELTLYSYKVDRHTNKVLPELADKHNHVIDALRYATESARRNIQLDTRYASAGPRVMASGMAGYGRSGFDNPIVAAEARARGRQYGMCGGMRGIRSF